MRQPKHILVVDDDDDVRDVIVDTLQECHYRASAVPGGSAMRDFLVTGDTVDCVIMDAGMPGEASTSLVLHLKKRNIPIIIISGSFEAMKYAEDNGLRFLQKPFRAQELYSSVNAALASGEAGQRSQGGG
jgi:two-component system, OmpR family, response regulator